MSVFGLEAIKKGQGVLFATVQVASREVEGKSSKSPSLAPIHITQYFLAGSFDSVD